MVIQWYYETRQILPTSCTLPPHSRGLCLSNTCHISPILPGCACACTCAGSSGCENHSLRKVVGKWTTGLHWRDFHRNNDHVKNTPSPHPLEGKVILPNLILKAWIAFKEIYWMTPGIKFVTGVNLQFIQIYRIEKLIHYKYKFPFDDYKLVPYHKLLLWVLSHLYLIKANENGGIIPMFKQTREIRLPVLKHSDAGLEHRCSPTKSYTFPPSPAQL